MTEEQKSRIEAYLNTISARHLLNYKIPAGIPVTDEEVEACGGGIYFEENELDAEFEGAQAILIAMGYKVDQSLEDGKLHIEEIPDYSATA